jgi:hypothetical protein
MVIKDTLSRRILTHLFRDFLISHTVSSLADELSKNRVGVWRELKKLHSKNFVRLSPIGSGKTNVFVVNLNWKNPLVEKLLGIYLMEEAMKQEKSRLDFRKIENAAGFLIVYENGLKREKTINIVNVVSEKNKFIKIKQPSEFQNGQTGKVKAMNFTETQFLDEIKKPNEKILEAIKSGIVLFGQEKFIEFLKEVHLKITRT